MQDKVERDAFVELDTRNKFMPWRWAQINEMSAETIWCVRECVSVDVMCWVYPSIFSVRFFYSFYIVLRREVHR